VDFASFLNIGKGIRRKQSKRHAEALPSAGSIFPGLPALRSGGRVVWLVPIRSTGSLAQGFAHVFSVEIGQTRVGVARGGFESIFCRHRFLPISAGEIFEFVFGSHRNVSPNRT